MELRTEVIRFGTGSAAVWTDKSGEIHRALLGGEPPSLRTPATIETGSPASSAARALLDYFNGAPADLCSLPISGEVLDPIGTFRRRIEDELRKVGSGEMVSYGELAARAGNPRAARAVGAIMRTNPVPLFIPCHRVIGSTGELVGFTGGMEWKIYLLSLEGIIVRGMKVIWKINE
ncbi:MAG: MGMT family protein [Candidatus Brocadiia bacterium]